MPLLTYCFRVADPWQGGVYRRALGGYGEHRQYPECDPTRYRVHIEPER